jgi:hypothetical protein
MGPDTPVQRKILLNACLPVKTFHLRVKAISGFQSDVKVGALLNTLKHVK